MSTEHPGSVLADRVRGLAEVFAETDLIRLRIERDGEEIELGRRLNHPADVPGVPEDLEGVLDVSAVRYEAIKADLVGIFRLSRPAPAEGDLLETDRELGYVEALGIRHPVRSLGAGRVVAIKRSEGDAVEYGEPLFEIDRG